MNALATLEAALLLGLYVALAGIWGVLWTLAQLRQTALFWRSAATAYALRTDENERSEYDRQPAQRSGRIVARL